MYDFIYWVFYQANIRDGKGYGRYNGSLVVGVCLMAHLFFLFSIFKKMLIARSAWENIAKSVLWGRPFEILIILLILISVFLYYNSKQTEKVLAKYSQRPNATSALNYFKVILIIFLPVIFAAIILSKF